MFSRVTNKSVGAEDGCKTRRKQQRERNKARVGSAEKGVVRRGLVYALVWKEEDDRGVGGLEMEEWPREKRM